MIDIKNISGRTVLSTPINAGSLHRFELMKEDYVTLVFSLETPVSFGIGDYIDYEGCRYVITGNVYPEFNASNAGYDYKIRLDSHYFLWRNHILFYDRQGNKEASWSLTRSPEAHLGIVVSNIRALGFTYNGKEYSAVVDNTVDPVAKLVTYDNTNIIDALTKIAEAWECEWWVDGDTIYLGKLEHGEPVTLEIGKEVNTMSRSQSKEVYATRLYVFGGTRNIPADYRKGEQGTVVEGVVQKRLMLPKGTPFIDVVPGLKASQIVEAVVVFDDIYPRTKGTITSVLPKEVTDKDEQTGETQTFTVYRFKDAALSFSEKYVLPGQELRVIFQTGPLSGMDFALKFNPDGKNESDPEAQVFEIIRNEDYGQTLPETPLIPGVGNQYILYNFDTQFVGDTLIPEAEQELLAKANAYKAKVTSDPSTYTCTLNSYLASGYDENNGLLNPAKAIDLKPGQKVNLVNKGYFPDGKLSRVIGFEKKLDIPYDTPVYTIGESSAYSRLGEMEYKLDNIQYKGNTYVNQGGGSGFGVYIIKKDDPTAASDENVFSALRTLAEINKIKINTDEMYLRKDIDDTAHGNILFDKLIGSSVYLDGFDGKGWRINADGTGELEGMRIRSDIYMGGKVGSPSFASGFTGWGWEIDTPTASGTVDNWTVRKSMKVYEMVYSQIYGLNSSFLVSDWNKVKEVSPLGSNRWHITIDKEDNMLMNLREGDIVRMQGRDDDSWGIRYFAAQVENVTNETFDLKILEGADVPLPGDHIQRIGNKVDKNRQGLIYFTSSDDYAPYIDILDGVTDQQFREENTKVRIGNLRGIRVNGQPLDMHGIYINGGIFQHSEYYLDDGTTIEQQFTIMDGKLNSTIDAVKKDLSDDPNNILRNSTFSVDTAYWEAVQDIRFINTPGGYVWLPSDFYVDKARTADIYRDGARNVLRLRNSSILQPNGIMRVPEHVVDGETGKKELKTYSFSFYYKALTPGTIRAGIADTELFEEQSLQPSDEYARLTKVGQWDGEGDFSISYDGEVLIWGVVMAQDRIADALIYMQTGIEQTAEQIRLWAEKEIKDSEGKILESFEGHLKVTAEQIEAVNTHVDNINNTIESSGWINTAQGQQLFAKKEMEDGSTIVSAINLQPGTVKIQAKNIQLQGAVSFSMLSDYGSVNNRINGKADSSSLGDLAYQDYVYDNDLSSSLSQTIANKVSSSALKNFALVGGSSISKSDLANALQTEINGKLTGSASASGNKLANVIINGQTLIAGGYIQADLINATDIVATNIAATTGTVGGWYVGKDYLSNSKNGNGDTPISSAHFDMYSTSNPGGNFLHMSPAASSILSIRADNKTGLSIYTQDKAGTCIDLMAQSGSVAMSVAGGCSWFQRSGEEWNMPGVLTIYRITTTSATWVWGNGATITSMKKEGTGRYTISCSTSGQYVPAFIVSESGKPVHGRVANIRPDSFNLYTDALNDNEYAARDFTAGYIILFGRTKER